MSDMIIEPGIIQAIPEPSPAQLPSLPSITPMEMLSRALDRGADLTVLEKLMDLQERYEKNEARKAFDDAVASAKAQIKPVVKNRTGNNSKYADLSAYAKEVDPILAKFGLSYRYRSRQDDAIYITCILSHREGHCEETTLAGGADATGSKNAIQAIGSTVEYLKRYTLTLALGLSAAEADDDGQAAGGDEPITDEQRDELQALLESTGSDAAKFCEYIKVDALSDIRRSKFEAAKKIIITKAKQKKPARQTEAAQ